MSKKSVMIYISNNGKQNKKLLDQMDEWDIAYESKNISENPDYMKELQDYGIFGTPATFIDGNPILGFQKNKMKSELGLENSRISKYRTL